jgi:hemolysin activation/secretion protein
MPRCSRGWHASGFFFCRLAFSAFLICSFLRNSNAVWAQGPDLPPSSSPEVIERKAREEAKEKMKGKLPEKMEVEEEKAPAAKEAEGVAVYIRKINLRPHETLGTDLFESLVAPANLKSLIASYEGRKVTFRELSELAEKVEQVLRARGHFAVVRIPPQEIEKEEAVLEVLFSRMGNLSVEGNRFFRKKKTLSYWRIPKGELLRFDKIEESLLALNENPDRKVKPLVKAGDTLGTTDVVLKVEDLFPLHFGYGLDNYGSSLTGKEKHTITLRDTNMLGLDDTFVVGTAFGEWFGALFLQHAIPVGSRGTRANWGFSHAQVNPKKDTKGLGINGISQTYSLGLQQRLLAKESMQANVRLGFDFKEKNTRIQSATQSWDRSRVLSNGFDIQSRDSWGAWTVTEDIFWGFSPHGDGFPLNSRQGENRFFKFLSSTERLQRLPWNTEGSLRFKMQLTRDQLTPQEQFFLGGAASVIGYPESDYGADQGLLTNVEHRTPFFFLPEDWTLPWDSKPLRQQCRFLVSFDHGYGRLHGQLDSELRTRNLLGLGVGFEVKFRENLVSRLEWGVPLGDEPITETAEEQFYLSIQFNI